MFRTSRKYLWRPTTSAGDCFHPYGNIIISTIQPHRSIVLTACRYKSANLKSRNYYELLGVEKTATQKEIKQAFFKLSKEYHPDANSLDKSLHEKFVKINEAFSILSKQSARSNYDQSLDSPSRYPGAYQRNPNTTTWDPSDADRFHYEMYRRRMAQDRQRYNAQFASHRFQNTYFAPASIVLILIGFGMFIHALQWRMMRFADPQYAIDARSRHNRAYREWQRLSDVRTGGSVPSNRRPPSSSAIEEEEDDEDEEE